MIKAVTYILNTDATFQTLVGQNVATSKYKAYPLIAPQVESVPYSICRMTSKQLQHKGTSAGGRNSYRCGFQVVSYADSYDDVALIDDAVVEALVPYSGTINGVNISFLEFIDSSDDYVDSYGGLFVRTSTFECNTKVTALT
jgi:hypothetical protein